MLKLAASGDVAPTGYLTVKSDTSWPKYGASNQETKGEKPAAKSEMRFMHITNNINIIYLLYLGSQSFYFALNKTECKSMKTFKNSFDRPSM